ncbi:MAG: hypothetical protein WKF47_15925 [Geodermatophilaceae bacterium]
MTLRKQRYLHASLSTSIIAQEPLPEVPAAIAYADAVGCVGFTGIQLREVPRSGRQVFIESNPRWGTNSRMVIPLVHRHGAAPIAVYLDCRECEAPVRHVRPVDGGAVSPLGDLLALRSLLRLKGTHRRHESRDRTSSASTRGRTYVTGQLPTTFRRSCGPTREPGRAPPPEPCEGGTPRSGSSPSATSCPDRSRPSH